MCEQEQSQTVRTEKKHGIFRDTQGNTSSKRVAGLTTAAVAVGLCVYAALTHNETAISSARALFGFAALALVGGSAAERIDGLFTSGGRRRA